jgi:hypothetical protein
MIGSVDSSRVEAEKPSLFAFAGMCRWPGLSCRYLLALLLLATVLPSLSAAISGAGFLSDDFKLTLESGRRTEMYGPFYYSQQRGTEHIWAIPPLFSYQADPATESLEYDIAYPLLTYDRFGKQYRWQLFQIISWAGGPTQTETNRDRFFLFPIYFHQKSTDPKENFTAVFPFYGRIQNHFFRNDIFFIMFPFYSRTRLKDVVTENYLYPFYHRRKGDGLTGWQLWPFYGEEHKNVTTLTNGFGDIETVPGHNEYYVMWPFYVNARGGIGTENPEEHLAVLPFYVKERSPRRDSTTYLWPFFSFIDDRDKKYKEWETPWPFVVKARGEGKTTDRIWPFFGHARNNMLQSDFYMWPVYKYNRVTSDPYERRRTRILFYLYSNTVEKNTETGKERRRVDFWPFYSHRREMNGNVKLQVLAPLEPFVPGSKSIERNYSQLWSLWRAEKNPSTGAASQSLLWNLYRRETSPDSKKCSLLFGLFQYQSDASGKQARWFYIPMRKSRTKAVN